MCSQFSEKHTYLLHWPIICAGEGLRRLAKDSCSKAIISHLRQIRKFEKVKAVKPQGITIPERLEIRKMTPTL
jgi:hypothetical protein